MVYCPAVQAAWRVEVELTLLDSVERQETPLQLPLQWLTLTLRSYKLLYVWTQPQSQNEFGNVSRVGVGGATERQL